MNPFQTRLRALLVQMDRSCHAADTPSDMRHPVPPAVVDRWRQEVRSLLVIAEAQRHTPQVRTGNIFPLPRGDERRA